MNTNQIESREEEQCSCALLANKWSNLSWNPPPCPYQSNNAYKISQTNPLEILVGITCKYGHVIGESIFSSDRLIGHWRIFCKSIKIWEQISHFNETFQAQMSTSIQIFCQKMAKLEKQYVAVKNMINNQSTA